MELYLVVTILKTSVYINSPITTIPLLLCAKTDISALPLIRMTLFFSIGIHMSQFDSYAIHEGDFTGKTVPMAGKTGEYMLCFRIGNRRNAEPAPLSGTAGSALYLSSRLWYVYDISKPLTGPA